MNAIPNRLGRVQALVFVCVFAVIGTVYLLVSHAFTPTNITLFVNTPGNNLFGATVSFDSSSGCNPNPFVYNYPKQYTTCAGYAAYVTAISYPGYQVSSSSQVKVGSVWKLNGTGIVGTITMEPIPPPPAPTPPPTPPPAPPPAPTPPPTTGGGTTPHTTPSGSPGTISVTPSSPNTANEAAPSTTDVQPATDGGGTIADTGSLNVLSNSDSTVTSGDNLVTVKFPKHTFDVDAACSIDQTSAGNLPVKSADLIGPYSIDCTDANGSALTTLNHAVTVNIKTPAHKTYLAYVNGAKWETAASNTQGKPLSFKLTKAELFAAAPKKSTNWGAIISDSLAVILLLLITGGIIHLIRRRQYLDTTPPPSDYDSGYSA